MTCDNCSRLERELRRLRDRLREFERWITDKREHHRQYMREWRRGRAK